MKKFTLGLHARLLAWLLVLLTLVWIGTWFAARYSIETTAATEFDQRLESVASLLLHIQVSRDQKSDAQNSDDGLPNPWPGIEKNLAASLVSRVVDSFSFEITSREHGVLASAGDFPEAAREASAGLELHTIEGQQWRVFTLNDDEQGLTSRVAVSQGVSLAFAELLGNAFQQPLLWLLPALLALAVISVWRGLAPLRLIEKEITKQDPMAPKALGIDRERVPIELRRLVNKLDQLMHRVGEVLTRQRAFTAGAGHELRTPLAGCRSQLQVAQRSHEDEPRQRALGKALHSLDHMTQLVDQLLLLARIDPAAPELDTRPVELGPLVCRLVAERNADAAEVELQLLRTPEGDTLPIDGNAILVETLVINLLDNAIRFSPPGGTVQVHLEHQGDRACLRVRDQGPGIPPDEFEHLFDPFFRSRSQGKGGNGLGLAIVQAVAKAHRGEAKALQPQHGGAEIIVYLPLGSMARVERDRAS